MIFQILHSQLPEANLHLSLLFVRPHVVVDLEEELHCHSFELGLVGAFQQIYFLLVEIIEDFL